jgi:large subunit ribosomal protein L30
MALIKITQERSKIRCLDKHKRTLAALGLRRIRHSVVKNDTPQIRGMIASVSYLVRVEPATAGDAKPARPAASAAKAKAPAAKAAAAAKSAAPRAPRAKSSATAAKGGSK